MSNRVPVTQREEVKLSTSDNPFNPWTQWDAWVARDMQLGHRTMEYLARMTTTSDELGWPDQHTAVLDAIDDIVEENINGLFIKVPKPSS